MARGENTGRLLEWHAAQGFRDVPGTAVSGANGIEVSADASLVYLSAWATRDIVVISFKGRGNGKGEGNGRGKGDGRGNGNGNGNGNSNSNSGGAPPPHRIPLGFLPDNIHRLADGSLLVGGQRTDVQKIADCTAQCPQPWIVARVDPVSG